MRRTYTIYGLTLFLLAGLASRGYAEGTNPTATIHVNLNEEKAPVPATLYGIFMEELSHAFDGGIYGELIQNRSFEEGVLPPGMKLVKKPDGGLKMELEKLPPGVPTEKWDMPWPWFMNCGWDTKRALIGWSLRNEGGAKGEMKLTEANPMNAASSRSLELTVSADGDGRVDLVNSGYWGISVKTGTDYQLKFYLRPGTFRGKFDALLQSHDGKTLAIHEFGEIHPGEAWQTLSATLKATGTDPQAQFVLRFRGSGTVQVDWVSLFPPTYKNRPNGLRPELAKYLEELKPAFIRYPGGCYVEGLSWESAPDWRKMVCPPEERPGMWGYWQYRSTDGFGYHEFLQFCEDIGAQGMYVAFAGMTVHPENNMPLDHIDPVIQRTLDAIEYARGPVDSKWGAVRAKMGHPQPFPLRYVEIGNEHPPAVYGDYYKKFRAAIKAKYPEIICVMSMFWSGLNPTAIARAGDANIDIVDEHSYRPSDWIRTNFDYFDKYPRKPWKIYVGEYAHHHNSGDWSAALDDSVYLMMLERNGDLVKMASYAPLFANLNQRSWGVNLIEFDSSRSFAHGSYYVQKTFNENRPDVNLATAVDIAPKPDPNRQLFAGRFGLGSWNTRTEFKDFRIYDEQGNVVSSDDFQSLNSWDTPGNGQWTAAGGMLKQNDLGKGPTMLLLKEPLRTGRVTLKARRVAGQEGFLMFFNATGLDRYMFCNYGAAGNHFSAIQGTPSAGIATSGGGNRRGAIENDRWYEISLVLTRNSAEMLLDGKRVGRIEAAVLPEFFATAGYRQQDKSIVLKATNYASKPVRAEIQLDGAQHIGRTGRQIVIHSDKPEDENTLDNPQRILPHERSLFHCAAHFSVTLEPRSVNVLCIPAERQPAATPAQDRPRGNASPVSAAAPSRPRWSPEQAWAWYRRQPWPVGFNYVPSTAANTTEFWSAETFDEKTIDRELGWGAGLGFNSCRVFVQYLVWKHDPDGLKQRLARFLALARRHGLTTTPVLFDDCAFGDPPQTEPYLGKQRDPIPGMILPSWTPSPGLKAVTDKTAWPDLEKYVKDLVGTFGQDQRVLMWDLYNEPGNSGMGNRSLPLVEATFAWARAVNPSQPLTMSPWGAPADLSRRQLELSDVISFHFYGNRDGLQRQIARYKTYGRPVINTEWMARLQGSRWETDLPVFKQEGVGCYSWGLVNGRTQCQFAWYHKRGTPEPKVWFHDLFHSDGRPYDAAEHEAIRKITTHKTRHDALDFHNEEICVVPRPDTSQANPYYPGNRPPLLPSPFIRLPTGTAKPQGWLRKQLELQAEGYIGHMGEVSGNLNKHDNAWLNPSGKGGCFWEEVPYWLRGYASLAFLLDDPKLVAEAKLWLEPSIIGQRPNGYFGTEAIAGGGKNAPDLMPHQNMLYAYRAYYDHTDDKRILDLMTRYFHWELTLEDKMFFNGGWGAARNSDNLDMVYWLYNRTGDTKLLELGEKLMRTGDRWMNHLGGCHNVAFCQGFRKPAVFYQQNKDPKYLVQMESNYNDIYDVYGQVPGGMFAGDEFARPGHTDPQQAIETCGAVEMMFSAEILLRITGDLKWVDRCENIAYNTLPATTTADFRGLRYLTSPNQCNSDARSKAPTLADDGPMQVMNPRDHHCCQHNLACAWPYFVESLYEATPDRGLAAMMYAPCVVTAQVGDGTKVTIEQRTCYPFDERIELLLSSPKSVVFPLYLRIPTWCAQPKLSINGRASDIAAKGGDLVRVARTWASGDKLVLDLPMAIAVTRWAKNHNSVSVNRGPLTYSVKIGEKYVRQHPERKDDKWPAYEIVPTTPWNYGLVLDSADPSVGIEVMKRPFPSDNLPFTYANAPIELKARAKRIPHWTENYFGVVDKLQPSPVKSDEPVETVTMVPMGAARLRMSALPTIGDGPDAKPWAMCGEPISSWSEDPGILTSLTGPGDPKDSRDGAGMFLMYSPTIAGSKQWIRMPLGGERTVSRSRTYWWTEHYEYGGVRPPASWKLFYKSGNDWKPVPNARGYGVAVDRYNDVAFDPVKTTELKIEIQFQPGRCGSLIRWRVE